MTGLPWFKCYPRDFNDGLSRLTLEERGAYITIINHIYIRGAPVEDDATFWRATLLCSGKAWAKIRAALLVKRRLYAVDYNGVPCLMDERCAKEIEENEEMRRKLSERGSRGGRKAQANARQNNDLAQAPAQAEVDLGSSNTEAESEADISEPTVPCPAAPNKPPKVDSFSLAWGAYPTKGRERSKSQAKTRPIWRDAAKAAGGEDRLLGAVQRYVREDQTHKGECGPPAFDRWLRDGRWEHWLPEARAPSTSGADPSLLALHQRLLNGTAANA